MLEKKSEREKRIEERVFPELDENLVETLDQPARWGELPNREEEPPSARFVRDQMPSLDLLSDRLAGSPVFWSIVILPRKNGQWFKRPICQILSI